MAALPRSTVSIVPDAVGSSAAAGIVVKVAGPHRRRPVSAAHFPKMVRPYFKAIWSAACGPSCGPGGPPRYRGPLTGASIREHQGPWPKARDVPAHMREQTSSPRRRKSSWKRLNMRLHRLKDVSPVWHPGILR